MRRVVFAVGVLVAHPAFAEWLTIVGTPGDPTSDSIQVDPTSLHSDGDKRLVGLRVSRATDRVNRDGITFRSYEATALIDCKDQTARYISSSFFGAPNFQGGVVATKRYDEDAVRPVAFWGMPGNNAGRLIDASCKAAGVAAPVAQ